MWFPLAMVLRSEKFLRYNVLSMVWLNLCNFIRKVCNWPKILVQSIKIQCFWALFFNRYRFDSNCCFTNIITSLHSISLTRFLEKSRWSRDKSSLLSFCYFFNEDTIHWMPTSVGVSKLLSCDAFSNRESHSHLSFLNVVAVTFNVAVTVKIVVSAYCM